MSPPLSLFILCGVFVTSLLSGVLGMAGGMVLMGMLVWVLPVQQAMMLHATSQFFANGSRAFIHREHLHTQSIKYYLAGLAITLVIFCLITFVPDKIVVFALLGIGPFLPQLLLGKVKFDFTKPLQAFFCGVIVTCFQLTGGVSGPLLDMFFQKIAMTRHQVVSTKAFTQSISHVTKFVYFGLIVPQAVKTTVGPPLWLYVAVIPIAILGSHLAKHILNRLTDHQFYKATQWMLWSIGAVYLVKAAALLMQGGS
jgi:uncharacterized membrane protein YfcA